MMGRIYNMEAEFLYVIIGVLFLGYFLELIYMLLFLRSQKSVLRKCLGHLISGVLSKVCLLWGVGQARIMMQGGIDGVALGLILWLCLEFFSQFCLVSLIVECSDRNQQTKSDNAG